MIKVENITVRFGGVIAVNDVSIHVKAGQITGLIGPNGAGKTTLFNTINGVQKAPEGHVYFEGKEITNGRGYKLCEAGISRTYQQINLFLGMSVLDNVMIGQHCRIPYGLFGSLFHTPAMRRQEQAAREECIRCLEMVGMADKKDLPAGALPYGEQRLIEIARALATKPKVLLLDEPAAGMNPSETSWSSAFRTVGRATENRAHSSCSEGNRSPAENSPDEISRRSASYTCLY